MSGYFHEQRASSTSWELREYKQCTPTDIFVAISTLLQTSVLPKTFGNRRRQRTLVHRHSHHYLWITSIYQRARLDLSLHIPTSSFPESPCCPVKPTMMIRKKPGRQAHQVQQHPASEPTMSASTYPQNTTTTRSILPTANTSKVPSWAWRMA